MQVHEQHEKLRGRRAAPAALVIGGMSEQRQIQAIRKGATIVVATPGRLEDYLRRKQIDLRNLTTLVLDEADRMLDMGFLPAIRRIVAALPRERQTLCFSATLEASVANLVNDYMNKPVRVAVGSTSRPADTVELQAFEVSRAEKSEVLRQLLYAEMGQTLVFARTKHGTERLAKHLVRDGFAAAMIHGDRTQSQRTGALSGFQAGKFQVLVATDVASPGIHVNNVAHVINYDLPQIPEDFIHGWAVPAAWARPGARQPWSRGGNRRIAFDGAGAEAEDRAQTDQRRPASCAAHNPEHAGNTHALPHAGRSILVARRRRKRADNRAISQPEIKRSRGSEEANISSHRRINDLPTTEPARKRFDWY